MIDEHLVMICKVISLCIFFPVYVGAIAYAYWKPNREKLEAHGLIPFLED